MLTCTPSMASGVQGGLQLGEGGHGTIGIVLSSHGETHTLKEMGKEPEVMQIRR